MVLTLCIICLIKIEGRSNYPKGVYLKPDTTASDEWLTGLNNNGNIPLASVKEMQSIDPFNTFYPMEIIATKEETEQLIQKNKFQSYLIFPEDRLHSIRMKNDLPQRWIESGPKNNFKGEALKGENFAFQLGIYALQKLENVKIKFTNLKSFSGKTISSNNIFCINTNGVGYDGIPFTKILNVEQNKVQALWCGIDVPVNATAGTYKGKAIITANEKASKEIQLTIIVSNGIAINGGVNDPWKMTRLRWLNSTLAQQNTVIAPYTALVVNKDTVSLLGRKVVINKDGFPEQIQTFFTPEMTDYSNEPNDLLTEPIHFHFTKMSDGKNMVLKSQGLQFIKKKPGTVEWQSTSSSDS